MIEITHKQARYLIRESEDRRLPEEQWDALQAHLERCAECSAYRSHLAALDKDLRRGMHSRWQRASGPRSGIAVDLINARRARRVRKQRLRSAFKALLIILAVGMVGWFLQRYAVTPAPTVRSAPAAAQPQPTVTATPALAFRGVVAFSAPQGPNGNRDIFLLNSAGSTGPERTNLTSDPADEYDPAWSPDGEWLAFLSDREGKTDLYVISVAGTRLTRLTADPNITWQGPLSWSYDGQWIALTGWRLDHTPWIYLVPLNGDGPRALAQTRGASGWARFSPSQPLLAVENPTGGLLVYDLSTGWFDLATREDNQAGLHTGADGAFDWALGGNSLLYAAEGGNDSGREPPEDEIRLSATIGANSRDSLTGPFAQTVVRANNPGMFRSVTYQPGGPLVATLLDANHNGCWNIRLVSALRPNDLTAGDIQGLCIDSPLERASWTPRGVNGQQWLVTLAHRPGETTPALYAVRVPQSPQSAPPVFERLGDVPVQAAGKSPGNIAAASAPRVRPSGAPLDIQPLPAMPVPAAVHPPLPPGGLPGEGLLAVPAVPPATTGSSAIFRVTGGGYGRKTLIPAIANNVCPTWSPVDPQQKLGLLVAFTSDVQNENRPRSLYGLDLIKGSPLPNEVFTQDITDGGRKQLTMALAGTGPSPHYDCPVWWFPPKGAQNVYSERLLAVIRRDPQRPRLVIAGEKTGELRIILLDNPSVHAAPIWTADGSTLLLAERASGGTPATIVQMPWHGPVAINLLNLTGWEDVQALSLSPDERLLTMILVREATSDHPARAVLRIYDRASLTVQREIILPGYDPASLQGVGRMFWLPDGRLVFALPTGPFDRVKANFVTYDPATETMMNLASSIDALIDWSIAGNYLVYDSESGLWAQPFGGGEPDNPIRLGSEIVTSLDWRTDILR